MRPNTEFALAPSEYDRFVELFSSFGIEVYDMSRTTEESLLDGQRSESISGLLLHGGEKFGFTRHKGAGGDHLSVIWTDHPPAALETLYVVIERALPQPEKPKITSVFVPHPWTVRDVYRKIGCVAAFVLAGLCGLIFIRGLVTLFRP